MRDYPRENTPALRRWLDALDPRQARAGHTRARLRDPETAPRKNGPPRGRCTLADLQRAAEPVCRHRRSRRRTPILGSCRLWPKPCAEAPRSPKVPPLSRPRSPRDRAPRTASRRVAPSVGAHRATWRAACRMHAAPPRGGMAFRSSSRDGGPPNDSRCLQGNRPFIVRGPPFT